MTKIKVAEMFAGVGGFRLGFEGYNGMSASSGYSEPIAGNYETVWANQYEPATKKQYAADVYKARFGETNFNGSDINDVDPTSIPDHDLLVGGFPCQDYSVASSLKNSKGLLGNKGILWWSIHRILSERTKRPNYLFFENVDRLINSPSKQRGRDFAIILRSLSDLGYAVEWRVVNAADYGMPQRRRRTFILGYQRGSALYNEIKSSSPEEWMLRKGVFQQAFPVQQEPTKQREIELSDVVSISINFNNSNDRVFDNSGVMIGGRVTTMKTTALYDGPRATLGDVLLKDAGESFFVPEKDLNKWKELKGAKNLLRKTSDGFEYAYSEGGMSFPDDINKPSRTIITGEGGASPSRFKHVVEVDGKLRRLAPVELERLNMFPDGHTELGSILDTKRAFFMGNAMVVGVVERVGAALAARVNVPVPETV